MDSIWAKSAEAVRFESLSQNIKTDVLVIGGGITGILCAHMLTQAGVDCAVVEANRVCGGVTQNTTAKITVQHGLLYHQLIRRFGVEAARGYWEANRDALEEYRKLCQGMDCHWEERDSYVYSTSNRDVLEQECKALQHIGCPASLEENLPLPLPTVGAVKIPRQAQFHPLKFAYALAKPLRIFENTRVLEWKPNGIITASGTVSAKVVIVATHFPLWNKHGAYFLKLYQHRSYVVALKNVPPTGGMYVDEAQTGLSFRDANGLLLLGGGSHRTGKTGGGWNELKQFARRRYPQASVAGQWATQDCMSLDGIPYIGQYSKRTPSVYVATGFNKWGMTSAMVSAMILRDEILGKRHAAASIFSPSRSVFRPQLAMNAAESIKGLLTPAAPRCPHMGCALTYNRQERSWDCSCHGSRFAEDGTVLNNPANGNKKM